MSEAGGALQLPKKTLGDRIHAAAKIGVGQVPVVGGALAELFAEFISPPLEKRKEKVLGEALEVIEKLKAEKGITVEELQENPKFIDSVSNATRAAMLTSSEAKRVALKNAMFNSALPGASAESKQQLFLHLVGELTESHLQILTVLDSPYTWFIEQQGRPIGTLNIIAMLVMHALPALIEDVHLAEFIFRDLYQRLLTVTPDTDVTVNTSDPEERRTTTLGREFLHFVARPYRW